MSEQVSIERRDEVAILRIDRPPANAIDLGLCDSMERQFQAVMKSEPGALVLTGGPGPFFCGGLDLKVVPFYTNEQQGSMILAINRMVARLYSCPVPVVAAVNGHAIAGGFILALIADYRVGPTGPALFGLTEARAGIPFPAGPMIVLQAEISPHQVRASAIARLQRLEATGDDPMLAGWLSPESATAAASVLRGTSGA